MRVLLTGKNGQFGQVLCAAAPAEWELLACDRQALDITHPEQVQQCVRQWRPDLIINAAAFTQVDAAESAQHAAWQANVVGPAQLARAARDVGATLLHFSTDYVFAGQNAVNRALTNDVAEVFNETDTPQPINYYGYSKWQGEQQVLEILPQARVIRTAWLFSPCGRNFVRTMLHLALRQPVLRIVNDQRGCPTSALQLARFLPALTAPSLPGRIYHLAGSPAVSWFEFAEAIFRCALACGWPAARLPRIEPIASAAFAQAAPRPSSSILCSERSRAALCAQLPAEDAASLTLDWRLSLPEVVRTLLRSDPELQAVCASA
ncbi:dTDP-4-dehydrorhamnose reductase [Plesiomonas shigelloides]|uniref:dTDP-4-dehydrorhamnose reductase n=1 Tax=Plesiomonas shigelloides TaxID=703 RepID=UPI0012627726|nr:dTDP-4-dehydrorhamnose reductase [Plesiomonas shigelloides]KAB7709669.1 dTDP-4-dehydrorhamnose reductase [Plesiomonas shigelloides]